MTSLPNRAGEAWKARIGRLIEAGRDSRTSDAFLLLWKDKCLLLDTLRCRGAAAKARSGECWQGRHCAARHRVSALELILAADMNQFIVSMGVGRSSKTCRYSIHTMRNRALLHIAG